MNVKITPSSLYGSVAAPSSKSYAHRLIIAAALSGGKTEIKLNGLSRDIKATVAAVRALGAKVTEFSEGLSVCGISEIPESAVIDCDESGSSLRFLLPVSAALGVKTEFSGAERLMQRPITALTDCMNEHGKTADGYRTTGKLKRGDYVLNASDSSQYITGMLFALCVIGGGTLTITGKEVSRGYVEVTADVLRLFGAEIEREGNVFVVKRGFDSANRRVEAEGDWSNAAFFLAAGAIGGEVSVRGLKKDSHQGDAAIADVLKKFGADVRFYGDTVTVKKDSLCGITADLENIPDLAQIIAVTAAFANGKTVLTSANRLKLKESDRIYAIISTLAEAGIKAEYSEECGGSITVYGGKPHGGTFDGGRDHRTVMSAAVLALNAQGNSAIIGAEAADKSYPAFFGDITTLGGKAYVEF